MSRLKLFPGSKIEKGNVYLADMNPAFGTEPGKIRPVVVVQTDMINGFHPSTIICPLTTKTNVGTRYLRVHLRANEAGLPETSDVLVDQIRAVDNRRLLRYLGRMSRKSRQKLQENLTILLS